MENKKEWKHFAILDQKTSIAILVILYVVGILGIGMDIHQDFILLTPFNLLISLALVLLHHKNWNPAIYSFLILAYLMGYGAEVFGVQTGILFGEYSYGQVLGWKIFGTPLMIGVNWILLAYCSGITTNYLFSRFNWVAKGVVSAIMMVLLDVLIEPVAIHYDFWTWAGSDIPLRNYVGWFVVALPILLFFHKFVGNAKNIVAIVLFIIQFLFFAVLGLGL